MKQGPGKDIILAVTGSIAAYKAASIARGLMDEGHQVRVIMTECAQKFITPATFRSLTGCPVVSDLFAEESRTGLVHIELAEWVTYEIHDTDALGEIATG